jgi:hypothetical protein
MIRTETKPPISGPFAPRLQRVLANMTPLRERVSAAKARRSPLGVEKRLSSLVFG